jgi:hypothetical protein
VDFLIVRFPIHCAASGGNVKLLSWLVDVHHCPIKMTNTGNRNSQVTTQLLETSKGRTVLDIAIENTGVNILQYLVNQKKLSIQSGGKNAQALIALEAVLKAMPDSPPVPDKTQKKTIVSTSQLDRRNQKYMKHSLTKSSLEMDPRFKNKSSTVYSSFVAPPLYNVGSEDSDDTCSDYFGSNDSFDDEDELGLDENQREDDESVSTTIKDPVSQILFSIYRLCHLRISKEHISNTF